MSFAYESLDRDLIDYRLQPVTGVPIMAAHGLMLFRGPAVDRTRPYGLCIGGAHTFGRFCREPYPVLLSDRLGMPVQNLGVGGAGPGYFDHAPILELIEGAQFVVFQVLSGRSVSNALYDNRLTCGPTGVRQNDGKVLPFDLFLSEVMATASLMTVSRVVEETRRNYLRLFSSLMQPVKDRSILFWWSGRSPHYVDSYESSASLMNSFPQLVNQSMVDELRAHARVYVEHESSEGLPQRLGASGRDIPGAALRDGTWYNDYYPSPEMHKQAADVLSAACQRMSGDRRDASNAR